MKKAVAQSLIIAELLPTWTELQQAAHKSVERQQVCDMKEGLLSHGLLFRTKCDLVQALISTGFALHHDDFASKALQLHKRFDPATDEVLWKFFSGRDNAELRDEILIVQLDVLTNTWRSLPQIIKEDGGGGGGRGGGGGGSGGRGSGSGGGRGSGSGSGSRGGGSSSRRSSSSSSRLVDARGSS